MSTELTTQPRSAAFDLSPQTFEQALTFANYLADSEMVPKNFRGKPGDCLIAMQWGYDVGLKPLQALQNISVINGKPGLYGDAGKAILLAAGCIIEEDDIAVVQNNVRARCKITRPGRPPVERTYSLENAKTAGLWGKEGPWRTSPWRQMAWRAFWFSARDAAADLLKGLPGAEEIQDIPAAGEKNMGAAVIVQDAKPECWPDDLFKTRLPDWRKAIADGRATADSIIAKAKTKHPLTDAQMDAIREPEKVTDPGLTPGEVSRQMDEAKDIDALNEAAALINLVRDPEARSELDAEYNEKLAELNT